MSLTKTEYNQLLEELIIETKILNAAINRWPEKDAALLATIQAYTLAVSRFCTAVGQQLED